MVHQQVRLVPFPESFYSRVANPVRVLTEEALHQHLAGDPVAAAVGPFDDTVPDTEEIRIRHCSYIPFRYVPILLDTDLSPRSAWLRLSTAIAANGDQASCRPLLDFLRAALTRSTAPVAPAVSHPWPSLPRPPDATLVNFYQDMLRRDLPALHSPTAPAGPATAVATQLGELVAETRQAREDARARQQRTPGIDDLYGPVGLTLLMRLCHVHDSLYLPPVYAALAGAPKRQRQSVVQAAVTTGARELHLHHHILVPPGLTAKILALEWASSDTEDLAQGINPFLVGQPTPSEEVQLQQHLRMQSLVLHGTAAPSLADAQFLASPPTVRIPTTLHDVWVTLASYHVYLHVLLGVDHPVTQSVRTLRTSLDRHLHRLQHGMPAQLPALILRYIQRKVSFWAEEQTVTDPALPYTTLDIIAASASGETSWHIPLPPQYLCQRGPAPFPPAPLPPTPPPPRQAPAAPALAPAPPPAPSPTQSVVRRENGPDPRFAAVAARGIAARVPKDKVRRGEIPPPLDGQGRQRCLAWTCKGMCNTRCGQVHDHRTDHSEDEQTSLLAWCMEHWVA